MPLAFAFVSRCKLFHYQGWHVGEWWVGQRQPTCNAGTLSLQMRPKTNLHTWKTTTIIAPRTYLVTNRDTVLQGKVLVWLLIMD